MGLLDRAIKKLPKQYQGIAGQIAHQVQEHQAQQKAQGRQTTPGQQSPGQQYGQRQQPSPQTSQQTSQHPAPSWGPPGATPTPQPGGRRQLNADEQAVARYRYLLQTAPPHELEQAHTEAFSRLTPEQRQLVLGEVSQGLPPQERPTSTEPQVLARAATRAEMRQPGFLAKAFSSNGAKVGAAGLGVAAGATVLGTMGALVVGTAVGSTLLEGVDLGEISGLADLGDLGIGDIGIGDLGIDGIGDQLGESVSGAVDGVTGDLGEQVGGLGDQVSGLGDSVSQAGEGLGGQVEGVGDQLGEGLSGILGDLKLPWD